MARAPAKQAASTPLLRAYDHAVSLPVFEGPLDLLLFLIRKNEIDIYDIPIEQITHQYLGILREMDTLPLELAGDFFVMAATLMQIKSRMLLPKDEQLHSSEEDDGGDIDPRWELVQQLIEYKKFKDASGHLGELIEEAQNLLFRDYKATPGDQPQRPLHPSDPIALWNTFNLVLRRLSDKIVVGQIHEETVTVAACMAQLLDRLQRTPRFRFSELLSKPVSVPFMISTFLALLELTRLRRIRLSQDQAFADILCEAVPEEEQPADDVDLEGVTEADLSSPAGG